ncbi:MAG: long-chain-fatty-acid--CoA ligase [Armatimonadota bacterium]
MTLFQLLTNTAQRLPNKTVLTYREKTYSFSELHQACCAAADGFIRAGVKKGDRVSIVLGNSPAFVIAYYGLQAIGAIPVPSNPKLTAEELSYIYNDAACAAAVCCPLVVKVVLEAQKSSPTVRTIFCANGVVDGCEDFDAICARKGISQPADPGIDPVNDASVFLYTSGTTGFPKGCMLSHHNQIANMKMAEEALQLTGDDSYMTVLPLFHTFASSLCMNQSIRLGGRFDLLDYPVPNAVLDCLERNRNTICPIVPTMYAAILHFADGQQRDLSSVRLFVSAGAPISVATLNAFKAKYGKGIIEGYGSTELSPFCSFSPLGGPERAGAVGVPVPGVEMAVVDENDQHLADEERGEIIVKGESVMIGYHNMPEATAEALKGGWYHTGDIGRRDTDGFYWIMDRKKDMLLVGGLNVYPREIEEVISKHPGIAEVAVIGEYDDLRGEIPVAFVVPKPEHTIDEHELLRFSRTHLANYKVPRRIMLRESLPKGPSLKILKRVLRDEHKAFLEAIQEKSKS